MYIAMNHFRVKPDGAAQFEENWARRESYLAAVPGFVEFNLLRGPEEDGSRLYASHTIWEDEKSFREWTHSESFRKAHAQGSSKGLLAGPPRFIGWQVVSTERP